MTASNTTSQNLRINGIVEESIVDGPGVRYAVFTQGCPHNCKGCHNPQTHDFNGGNSISVDKLFSEIKDNPLISGVTFSGGEPLSQPLPLYALAKKIKDEKLNLDIAVYTGYSFENIVKENDPDKLALLSLCDILIDGPFVLSKKDPNLSFRGSSNQRILDLQKSLKEKKAVLSDDATWLPKASAALAKP